MPRKNRTESLVIENLKIRIEDKEVVGGLSLTVKPGEVHAVMGPNGTGKSTLALALMGHPRYDDAEGSARIGEIELLDLLPEERARAGLFLAMQYPAEIPGVPVADFVRTAHKALSLKPMSRYAFKKSLASKLDEIGMDRSFSERYVNEGFSGGEKKRSEIVQASLLKPRFAILDEIDSGLDIDALKSVAKAIGAMRDEGTGVIIITHYRRILDHLPPDHVHVMAGGTIVRSAPGLRLAEELEAKGYEGIATEEVSTR